VSASAITLTMDDSTGARLRAWREKHKPRLSQAAAAKEIGTTQRTWADWEAGEYSPEIDFAEAIERLTKGKVCMRHWAATRRAKRNAARKDESGTTLPVTKAAG
jgi:DNA-binding XRE family transcriptional regulator